MNLPEEQTPWERLAAARRAAVTGSVPATPTPDPGFVSRLASRVGEFLQNERVRLWSRWCLFAAAAGGVAALASGVFSPKPSPPGPPLKAPLISVPAVAP